MKPILSLAFVAAAAIAPAPAVAADRLFEHSYAVVIGIDRYSSQKWPQLEYAVKDAKAIATFLAAQNYDDVITLLDERATKKAILSAMQNRLAPKLTNKDRVLVFFAGHGETETLGGKDRGYIVPFDGGEESAGYISMDELENQSDYMSNARHQLFIVDSCYGGAFAVTRGVHVSPDLPDYLKNISGRIARQVITAGGKNQQVLDGGPKGHSYFVDYFLEAVAEGKADTNGDGYITLSELSAYLEPRASNRQQTPMFGSLPGHQAGEYLFVSPLGPLASGGRPRVPATGCIPDIAVNGPPTIDFVGTGCAGIDPADLQILKGLLRDYPAFHMEILQRLSRGDETIGLLVKQLAQAARATRSANQAAAQAIGRNPLLAAGPPPAARALQANDADRGAAAKTISQVESILKNAGLGLTPQNLAAMGWLFQIAGNYENAIASFLAAKDADPSLASSVYLGLGVAYQLNGYELIQRGDFEAAEVILAKAEDNTRLAQQYEPAESSAPLGQLGFIKKDLANTYLGQKQTAKAEAALASAETLFQQVLGANPKDVGAHNGLGDVYYARGDNEKAIAEYQIAVTLQPDYIYAWHDLTLALYAKYTSAPPDKETLARLIAALQKVLELEQMPGVQKLPRTSLDWLLKLKDFVLAEAAKFPK